MLFDVKKFVFITDSEVFHEQNSRSRDGYIRCSCDVLSVTKSMCWYFHEETFDIDFSETFRVDYSA